MRKYVTYVGLI